MWAHVIYWNSAKHGFPLGADRHVDAECEFSFQPSMIRAHFQFSFAG